MGRRGANAAKHAVYAKARESLLEARARRVLRDTRAFSGGVRFASGGNSSVPRRLVREARVLLEAEFLYSLGLLDDSRIERRGHLVKRVRTALAIAHVRPH
jgi:hypothetical protein